MIKRVVMGAGVALLLGLLLFGRNAWSYVRTSVGYMRDSVESSIPTDVQIDRARRMIKDLKDPIERNMHLIAKEEVEVERLQKQVGAIEARLANEKQDLLKLKGDLASGKSAFEYGGRKYSVVQVKQDLANRFERYKTGEATAASLQEMHRARQRSLDAARQKFEAMLAARRQLQVDVENLEARSQMIAAAQTTSNYQFDDSELGRVKELVTDLRTRLDVAEKLVNADGYFQEQIPVDQATPADIVEQIGQHFASPSPAAPDAKKVAQNR
jgi:chromosome segregation ATPase